MVISIIFDEIEQLFVFCWTLQFFFCELYTTLCLGLPLDCSCYGFAGVLYEILILIFCYMLHCMFSYAITCLLLLFIVIYSTRI